MKTILLYGDSNLRGFIPGTFIEETRMSHRYLKNKRLGGIIQNQLGQDYDVIEEGIAGRTTDLDEISPGRPYRNGLADLPFCLESHYPLDLVILWLGTNDCKVQFNRSAEQMAEGLRRLIKLIKNTPNGENENSPQVLIIAPQPLLSIADLYTGLNKESIESSEKLAFFYEKMAKEETCEFLDAGKIVTSSEIDGIHLDEEGCKLIGTAIANKIRQILN